MPSSIVLLAHNIRSMWNVGSLFRCADAFGVEHLYLTGYTACPPRREIAKTAIGVQLWIPWSKADDPQSVIRQLRQTGYTIVSLEAVAGAVPLHEYEPPERICLIIGHEVLGVPPELINASELTVGISMRGRKSSLNVAVAAGIALYQLTTKWKV